MTASVPINPSQHGEWKAECLSWTKDFLDIAMRLNPEAKMCPGSTIEKKIVRKAFADMLPDSVAWRQKEQFSDGVGYSWIDTLKALTAEAVSDEQMAHAARTVSYQYAAKQGRILLSQHLPGALSQ